MSLAQIKDRLPDYARDLKLNLSAIGGASELTPRQMWGAALASALASRNAELIAAVAADAAPHLDEVAQKAAKAAAAVMGMNNIYYRFTHFMEGTDYAKMPARLRMQVIGNPGVDHVDFELWCLAVSAITGCEMCVRSHEKVVRDKGASAAMVQDAVRIAAILHGVAAVLDGEDALAPPTS
jgi:lipoyl-dependent peroxiredoxin subunit D